MWDGGGDQWRLQELRAIRREPGAGSRLGQAERISPWELQAHSEPASQGTAFRLPGLQNDTVHMAPFGPRCLGSSYQMEQWHSSFSPAKTAIRANIWPCHWLGSCCVLPQLSCAFLGRCPAPRSAAGINLPTSLRSHFISGHPAAVRLLGLAGCGSIAFLKFQISVSGLCPSKKSVASTASPQQKGNFPGVWRGKEKKLPSQGPLLFRS